MKKNILLSLVLSSFLYSDGNIVGNDCEAFPSKWLKLLY